MYTVLANILLIAIFTFGIMATSYTLILFSFALIVDDKSIDNNCSVNLFQKILTMLSVQTVLLIFCLEIFLVFVVVQILQ